MSEERTEYAVATRDGQAGAGVLAIIERLAAAGQIEAVERLVALREREQAGEARREFYADMGRFQACVPAIPKTREVRNREGKLVYLYAPLDVVVRTIRDAEAAAGFRHSWDTEAMDAGGVRVTCTVSHRAGHAETSAVTIPATKGMNTSAAQDRGIEITYGQRRSLLNAYGLAVGGEDTDARAPVDTVTEAQAHRLREMIDATGTDAAKLCAWVGCESVPDIPAARFAEVLRMLESKRAKAEGKAA